MQFLFIKNIASDKSRGQHGNVAVESSYRSSFNSKRLADVVVSVTFLQCYSLLQGNTVVDQTLAAERTSQSAEVWFGIEETLQ